MNPHVLVPCTLCAVLCMSKQPTVQPRNRPKPRQTQKGCGWMGLTRSADAYQSVSCTRGVVPHILLLCKHVSVLVKLYYLNRNLALSGNVIALITLVCSRRASPLLLCFGATRVVVHE